MNLSVPYRTAIVALLLISPRADFANQRSLQVTGRCGAPVAGIQLCLSPSLQKGRLRLELRNTGPKDVVLNLGVMFGNGARQYPTAITLIFEDAQGKKHRSELAEPAMINGRLDPFVVPLPSRASLKVSLEISKYRLREPGQPEGSTYATHKNFTVQAQLTGKPVSQAQANLDCKGIAVMPYWTATVASNAIPLE